MRARTPPPQPKLRAPRDPSDSRAAYGRNEKRSRRVRPAGTLSFCVRHRKVGRRAAGADPYGVIDGESNSSGLEEPGETSYARSLSAAASGLSQIETPPGDPPRIFPATGGGPASRRTRRSPSAIGKSKKVDGLRRRVQVGHGSLRRIKRETNRRSPPLRLPRRARQGVDETD